MRKDDEEKEKIGSKMKAICTLSLILGCSSLFAENHSSGVSVHADPWKSAYSLKMEHQVVFPFDDDHFISIHGLLHPKSISTHHSHMGVGYRKFYQEVGFGLNFLYAASNKFGFHAHQLVPGFELFFNDFRVCLNNYLPCVKTCKSKNNFYHFHRVTEMVLGFQPSDVIDISISSNINHSTKKIGYHLSVSGNVYKNWNLGIHPYLIPSDSKGVSFSVGYNFGGRSKRGHQPIIKSHGFFYSSEKAPTSRKEIPTPAQLPLSTEPTRPTEPKLMPESKQPLEYVSPPMFPGLFNEGMPIEIETNDMDAQDSEKASDVKEESPPNHKDDSNWISRLFFWKTSQ